MASNVAAMLILAMLLAVITLMARSTIVSSGVIERSTRAALERAAARAETNFSIESITSYGTTTTIKLKNTGETPASDYSLMDFIATYVSGGSTVSTRLTYTEGSLLADQWKKTSISPDNLEKDTWNQTETLTLDARLSSSPDASTTATFAVGTPDGVVRTESVVVAAPFNDTFEFDTAKGLTPNIIPISGDVYAIAYRGDNDDGFVTTVTIATDGQITDTAIDTLEYDTGTGRTPKIIQIAGNVYAIAYDGNGNDGFLATVTIATDGQITDTVIDTEEFDTSNGETPDMVAISGVYAIAYEGPNEDGFLKTIEITTSGQIP